MAKRHTPLVNGEFYHVIFRGVDGRNIFQDNKDYYRMVHDVFEFNDIKPAVSTFRMNTAVNNENEPKERKPRDFIVKVHAFCLMPNHVHLLLEQVKDQGITKYMQKLCGGYSRHFNSRHKRKGHLFQDKFKSVHIENNKQFDFLFTYVHSNPIAIIYPDWKEKGVENYEMAIKFIEEYKWSSYRDYLTADNFPSLTQREFFLSIQDKDKWKKDVNRWVEYKSEIFDFDDEDNKLLALEDDF